MPSRRPKKLVSAVWRSPHDMIGGFMKKQADRYQRELARAENQKVNDARRVLRKAKMLEKAKEAKMKRKEKRLRKKAIRANGVEADKSKKPTKRKRKAEEEVVVVSEEEKAESSRGGDGEHLFMLELKGITEDQPRKEKEDRSSQRGEEERASLKETFKAKVKRIRQTQSNHNYNLRSKVKKAAAAEQSSSSMPTTKKDGTPGVVIVID